MCYLGENYRPLRLQVYYQMSGRSCIYKRSELGPLQGHPCEALTD